MKVKIFHPDTSVNKVQVELSPVPLNDSILLYSSLRSDTNIYVNQDDSLSLIPRRKFYTAKKRNDSTWVSQGEYAEGWFNLKDTENGNGCFNRDSSQFYFQEDYEILMESLPFIYIMPIEKKEIFGVSLLSSTIKLISKDFILHNPP